MTLHSTFLLSDAIQRNDARTHEAGTSRVLPLLFCRQTLAVEVAELLGIVPADVNDWMGPAVVQIAVRSLRLID